MFGLQPGQRGNSLLRNGSEQGGVSLEFEVDGKSIILERTLKRKKSISQDYASITIDGEKQELSVTELKNKVLELLNYPREFSKKQNILYKFTVYTPQEEMKQIILQDAETRINTLRHVFGIDKYKRILENTSILLSKIREEKRLNEGRILNLESYKNELISKQKGLEEKKKAVLEAEAEFIFKNDLRKKAEAELEEISKQREEKLRLKQEIEKTKILLSTKNSSVYENKKNMEQIKSQIEDLDKIQFEESKLKVLDEEIVSLNKKKQETNEKILEISSTISSLNLQNEEHKKTKEKIVHLDSCPTCLQNVDSVYKSNVELKLDSSISENINKIKSLQLEKINFSKEHSKIEEQIIEKQKQINELNLIKVKLESLNEKKQKLLELENYQISLEKDIGLLNSQLSTLKESILDINKYDLLFQEKQKKLEESLKQEKLTEIKIAELKKEVGFFTTQIEDLKNKISEIESIRSHVIYLSELEEWVSKKFLPLISNIERNVMNKLKKEFSSFFAEWFSMLVADNFNVGLDDNFTPIIEQQDYEIDYAHLSGGERTAVALAYRLALNQVINSVISKIKTKDIVILDEPTDGFSETQLDKMRSVLEQLDVAQLIVVSHEQKIEGFVDNVIKFRKEKGISVND